VSKPPTVDLATGATASAILEGFNAPVDQTTASCPAYTGLLVTPPEETHTARVALAFSLCSVEIHPVVPGDGGGGPVSCPDVAFRPQSSDLATDVAASATTCDVARSVVLGGPDVDNAGFGKDYTTGGFACVAGPETQPPGGGMSTWTYRCTDAHGATVTFARHA
jgi:hypothetical protein